MLDYSHSPLLVLASFAVALMAAFTGMSLTKGISNQPLAERKLSIVMAAIALGGGIWSMHFVAMLGVRLPVLFFYDALTTLISALIAILMAGVALLIMHFLPRTPSSTNIAGTILGIGIATMHYVGMSGMQNCAPVYSVGGVVLAVAASIILSVLSFRVAYSSRTHRDILFGTACFGVAVFVMHFVAMGGTGFVLSDTPSAVRPGFENSTLAVIVTLAAFLISGSFLLTGVTFFPSKAADSTPPTQEHHDTPEAPGAIRVPYETDGRILFLDASDIAAVRAEGHYTVLYIDDRKLFCPWSISEAEQRLPEPQFMRAHRSYLINTKQVTGFERKKDNGICFFEHATALGKVPVSRSRLSEVRDALGL
ncbi:MHYT domain-containing protein [Actibacterium lipolyticum]|uniref:CO-responsive transcriptional regulator RcoM n=1 Tax=Actibacterium lipolyticum TaxID=1524263 RepID=A0A238JNN1_9RHOB|nr:MHYT domain-containing protein [Actibacterium lipolyticum]SMX32095.1 CO-responsive transcriptional regulator RcoM [Actibacterium lipolyticum]